MRRPSTLVRLTALGISLIYAVVLYLNGVHLHRGVKEIVGYIPTLATLLLAVWDVWLWRLPGIQHISGRPWLGGVWSATLLPTAESHIPEGGNKGPIRAYIVIRQTYWSIAVRQYTAESRSDSRAAIWAKTGGGELLTYNYTNKPRRELEARSQPHLGTAALDVVGLRPNVLHGDYFTDRYTKGDMEVRLFDRSTGYGDFAAAQEHCGRA
jgi:hypothetical protein